MATTLSSPSTPSSHRSFTAYTHVPSNSSPLASSPAASPTPAIQERRRGQYKTLTHVQSSPTADRTRFSSRKHASASAPRPVSSRPELSLSATSTEEAPGKKFLRERFKARCLERALKDRERKIAGKRRGDGWSSDPPDEDMMDEGEEDEDEDEAMLNDAFFSRIMASVKHQRQHSYRLSYAQEVGSSFDPDMEDAAEWENELRKNEQDAPDDILVDEDEIDLAAYAAEQELLDGLTADDIFTYSDVDDVPHEDIDIEMEI